MISSTKHTSIVSNALGVDPKLLEKLRLLSWDDLISRINQVLPIPPPFAVGDLVIPGLALSDGSSQMYVDASLSAAQKRPTNFPLSSSSSPPYSLPFPQPDHIDYESPFSPTTHASSSPPYLPATHVLTEAPCAGGRPIKENGQGYRCSICGELFKRRDDAKRHIETAGKRVECRYCGKPASGRRDGQRRHVFENKTCQKLWEAGYKTGRFTERSVEDAYR